MTETIRQPVQPITTVREDLVTSGLSLWLIAGVLVDGWAHVTRGAVETFFTPWHALFYSGFAAVSAWIVYVARRQKAGPPVGYRLGLVGIGIFASGGVGDLLWHQFLGIETSIDALVSPTHLLLLSGAMLIITTPIRAGWHRPTPRGGRWSWHAPGILAAALVGILAQFFYLYASGWGAIAFLSDWQPGSDSFGVAMGMVSLVVSTMIFMSLGLILIRRWDPPPGTFTLLIGAVGLAMGIVHGLERPGDALAAILGGAAVDWLTYRLHPDPARPTTIRAWALLAPIAVWGIYVAYLAVASDLGWPFVLWSGAVLMMGLWGLGLSLVALPPPLPGNQQSS